MHKELKFGASKKPFKHTRFSTDPVDGMAALAAEMGQIDTAHMAALDPVQVIPEPFVGIERGGIGRQALPVKPTTATRARVQTWPRKPSVSAPRGKSSGRQANWSADKRRGTPGGERC